jgi:hypothetical protein
MCSAAAAEGGCQVGERAEEPEKPWAAAGAGETLLVEFVPGSGEGAPAACLRITRWRPDGSQIARERRGREAEELWERAEQIWQDAAGRDFVFRPSDR